MAARRRLRTRASALRTTARDRPPRPTRALARFDAAVHQLNQAGAGDTLADIIDAYAAIAQAASELADALQAAGE